MSEQLHYEEGSSLELPASSSPSLDPDSQPGTEAPEPRMPQLPRGALIIIVIVVLALVAGGAYAIARKSTPQAPAQVTINTQSLDNGTLNKLTTDTGSKDAKQQLVITPDTVFKNTVTVNDIVTADKGLNIGGNLNVSGSTSLQGPAVMNGNLAVRGSLSVSGSLSAGSLNVGALAVSNINASGNISFGGHIIPTGAVPSIKPSAATSGGSVRVDGNDTAGTITITVGSGGTLPGEMAIMTFTSRFSTTPKVQLTPVTGAAADLHYYVTRSPGFFTIETTTAPANGGTYVFDYLVTQ